MQNTLQFLLRREITGKIHNRAQQKVFFPLRFSGYTAKREFEVSQQRELHLYIKPDYTKIREVYVLDQVVITLTCAGVCCLFNRQTGRFVETLNGREQFIQTIFHNKHTNSLFIVFVTRYDSFSSLRCRTTSLDKLPLRDSVHWKVLFTSEVLKYPGFIEFDELNRKLITYCSFTRIFKLWDLDTHKLVYKTASNTREIKISSGLILLVGFGSANHVPLNIVAINSGKVLATHQYPVSLGKKMEIIEMFQNKLLIKEEGQRLQLMDIVTGSRISVSLTKSVPANRIISLVARRMFIGLSTEGIIGWDFDGDVIFSIQTEFNLLYHTKMFLSTTQNIVIITSEGCTYGLDLHTGKYKRIMNHRKFDSKITAIAYDEDTNELFCGDEQGGLCMWSHD